MRTRLLFVFVATGLLNAPGPIVARTELPSGYTEASRDRLAAGVHHSVLERDAPSQSINVAHVRTGSKVAMQVVTAQGSIAGPGPRLERTSSMCARVECLAAVNGDFFRSEIPVGAVAAGGELLRSPNPKHHQLFVTRGGRVKAGPLPWSGRLVATDLSELTLDGVNVERGADDLILYTPAYGARSDTNPHGVEVELRFVAPRNARLPIGQTAVVRVVGFHHGVGDSRIRSNGAILSAHGTSARELGALWRRIQSGEAGRELLLRVETTPRVDTVVGGTPVLLRDGRVWFSDSGTSFMRSRHPRTLVGWNRDGDLWLVTVDGRSREASGFSMLEAATFLRDLGATEAINLDGGGSTTFVVGGAVVNRPSDRAVVSGGATSIARSVLRGSRHVERPVANALVLVRRSPARAPVGPPDLAGSVPRVETLSAPRPSDPDPASDPSTALPAIVAAPNAEGGRGLPLAIAGGLHLVVAWALVRKRLLGVLP